MQAARDLAHALHKNDINLVYGGGSSGMMGEVARTLVSLSGPDAVHGIIPEPLLSFERAAGSTGKPEIDRSIFGRTTVVPSMHARTDLMVNIVKEGGPNSGFCALSGGYGTLEELSEVVTWNQLGIHARGVVVFNVEGYYDALIQWVKGSVSAGFIKPGNANIFVEALTADEVIEKLKGYQLAEHRLDLDWSQK